MMEQMPKTGAFWKSIAFMSFCKSRDSIHIIAFFLLKTGMMSPEFPQSHKARVAVNLDTISILLQGAL